MSDGLGNDRKPRRSAGQLDELRDAAKRLVALFDARDDQQLEHLANRLLERFPDWGLGWKSLGASKLRRGELAEAIDCFRRSAKASPRDADVRRRLAVALRAAGDLDESIAAYRSALELVPEHAQTRNNLGNALLARGRGEEAIAAFRQAIACKPDYAEAHFNFGIALKATGEVEAAIAAYRSALSLRPDHAQAWNNLGSALHELGECDDAIHAYRSALAADPNCADAWNNLGNALAHAGRTDESLDAYRRALEVEPGRADVYLNLGNACARLERNAEAIAHFRRALAIDPAFGEAHFSLGNLLVALDRHSEAADAFRSALGTNPAHGAAVAMLVHASRSAHSWQRLSEDTERLETAVRRAEPSELPPFPLLAIPGITPADQKRAASNYVAVRYRAALRARPLVEPETRYAHDRLRIGYLSADFHDHATMHLLAGVLERHDQRRLSIHLYSYGPDRDGPMRRRAVQACEVFRDIRTLSDASAARRIADDEIDLLVDLKGYTKDARPGICLLRPAPVIASWLGYPGSLGHPGLADYLIGDPIVTPLDHADRYSETLAQLPHCYQPNDRGRSIGAPPNRTAVGLPESGFVFCSFNQGFKLGPEMFDNWCRLLHDVPDSVLWLLEPAAEAIDNLRREAAQRGVDPARLVFAPRTSLPGHLARIPCADLALDTFPYTSHTTGSDALWAGVPLVTCMGEAFASRVAASLLHSAGLPETITATLDDYVSLARALALNRDRLRSLRARLESARGSAPLFDTEAFTLDLEALYLAIREQHRLGERRAIASE